MLGEYAGVNISATLILQFLFNVIIICKVLDFPLSGMCDHSQFWIFCLGHNDLNYVAFKYLCFELSIHVNISSYYNISNENDIVFPSARCYDYFLQNFFIRKRFWIYLDKLLTAQNNLLKFISHSSLNYKLVIT